MPILKEMIYPSEGAQAISDRPKVNQTNETDLVAHFSYEESNPSLPSYDVEAIDAFVFDMG